MPALLDGRKVPKDELDELLNSLNLYDRRTHLPNELSGGQQQRVAIGRAMVNKPPIILADEPTGNLDTQNTEDVMNLLIKAVRERNQTLVLITHEPEIAEMADRVLRLEDGRIASDTMNPAAMA
jgi:putative ABC transport system ATP-binding protein